ncbi:MAG: VOC family protein [Actinomycetota bacterium]
MRVDHVSYVAENGGLTHAAEQLGKALGVTPVDGGVHPRFGTRNVILPLAEGRYIEVVEVLDHPASDKAPFGQAVRMRAQNGGGWLGWVVAVDDLAPAEQRLGRLSVPGNRHRPDGVELRWRQIGVKGLIADPQLPFLVQWEVPADLHPSAVGSQPVGSVPTARLTHLQIAGDKSRVLDWLGLPDHDHPADVAIDFVAPHGNPGLLSCTFASNSGQSVTI